MVSFSKDWIIITAVSYLTYLVFYKNLEAGEIFQRGIYILFGLGAVSFFIHLVQSGYIWILALRNTSTEEDVVHHQGVGVLSSSIHTDAQKQKEQEIRQRIQEEYTEQVRDHEVNVVQPREEAKLKKKEEDFYKFMGPAWKGSSNKLGHCDGTEVPSRVDNIAPVREASELRHLPDEVMNPPPPPPKPKPPRKIALPEEPAVGTEGSVTLMFRTPISRVLKRRFLLTDSVQLVLDYITTCGFSRRVYTVSTSYPRYSLSQHPDDTLQEVGITTDTALNIEEKE